MAINKSKDYSFPTKTNDLEGFQKLEDVLKKTKYWNNVSVFNATKMKQLLEEDIFDAKTRDEIIKLAPIEEEISLSIKKIN